MTPLNLVLFLGSSLLTLVNAVPHVNAGIVASFKQSFVDDYKNTFNLEFLQELQRLVIPSMQQNFTFSMFNVAFGMDNIQIEEAIFDPKNTNFAIKESKPNIVIDMKECSFAVGFNYSVVTTPELVTDHGYGKAWMKGMNISVKGNPGNKNNNFQFNFDDIEVEMEDFGLDIQGGDLSILVNFFEDSIKSFIRDYLLGKMNW